MLSYFSMASSSMKAEDRFEGASNFNAWKTRVLNILEESDLHELFTRAMEEHVRNARREAFKKRQAKAKGVNFDLVKDSTMPPIAHLRRTKDVLML